MPRKKAETIAKERAERDMQDIVRLILASPVKKGPVKDIGELTSLEAMMKANTDVRTRIWIRVAGEAMSGDLKAAELIMRQGGYEPVKETNINVKLPTIIDDMAGMVDEDTEVPILPPKKQNDNEPPMLIAEMI